MATYLQGSHFSIWNKADRSMLKKICKNLIVWGGGGGWKKSLPWMEQKQGPRRKRGTNLQTTTHQITRWQPKIIPGK